MDALREYGLGAHSTFFPFAYLLGWDGWVGWLSLFITCLRVCAFVIMHRKRV
jgi:hypothetical protein